MKKISIVVSIFSCLLGMCSLASCESASDLPGTQILRMNNQEVEVLIRKHDDAVATIVLESGARNCIQRWEKVLKQLPKNVNVYAYNRPGYCGSARAITERNSENIVSELRMSLHHYALKPPYILVGHSIGGLYIQHFARQHPDEVQGLVLVDAMYPGFLKAYSEFPWYTKMGMTIFMSKTVKQEISFAHKSGEIIDALPLIDDKPVIRLFNKPKGAENGTAVAVDFGMFNRDDTSFQKIKNMYPNAKIAFVDSSHQIQETSPELVVQAIKDVMNYQIKNHW